MQNLLEKEPDEVFEILLKYLPDSSLRSFLIAESMLDASLIHRFIIRFAEETKLPAEEKYLLRYRSIVLLARYSVQKFSSEMDYYLEGAENLFAAQNYLDAFFMAANLIRE